MRPATALLLVCVLLATAALAVQSQTALDPLAQYRAPDGSLHIPGRALTPELQHLLFGGNDLQPFRNISYYAPARSPYPTMQLVERGYQELNLNVFTHPKQQPETIAGAIAHLTDRWFQPVDWGAFLRSATNWVFDLFTFDARAAVVVDQTNTGTTGAVPLNTCTTTQTAAAADNAIIVLLTERGTTTYLSVTYGSASLTLIAGATQNNPGSVRSEIWGFAGTIPAGAQTMTATLTGAATSKQTCATVLLQGVDTTGPFINGTGSNAATANAAVSLAATVAPGNLAFGVLALRGIVNPTAVAGTGATATSLYGTAAALCTSGNPANSNVCGAGADLPNPGTALTWTSVADTWAISAAEAVAAPSCGSGGANCYRIGTGGNWNTPTRWSNTPGGASCGCTPSATDNAIFDATPTGTTSLAGATTIASIDMTGFTGTLDTTNAGNWPLTVNGNFTIQGTFLPEGSTITVTGNLTVVGPTTVVTMSTSSWTVSGTWTNDSTSASWSAGTSSVTIKDAAGGTLTFANLAGATNEFNNLVLDASVTTGVVYTMATNGLRMGGTLTIQNSTASATGPTVLDTSASNLSVTAGGLTQSTLGGFNTRASPITINGNATISATNAYVTNAGGSWSVSGTWTNRTTSASWSFAAGMTFRAGAAKTMTFAGSNIAGNEFAGTVTFDATVAGGVTFTMAANAPGDASLRVGAALVITNSAGSPTAATILDTSAGNYNITAASLTLGSPRGALRSEGSTITINGPVTVSDANSYIVFGSATWTVTGTWTNSSTDSIDWSAGTGTLTFKDAANATMTFANLGANEFNNVVFDTTVATGITYTMATNGLRIGGALTVQNTAVTPTGNTVLITGASNLAITAGGIVIGTRGTLTANVSTITVNGSWTSSAANHVWNQGTSTVVFGATGTLTMSAGDSFNVMTQSAGTTTLGSNVTVSGATTVNGTLDTSGSNYVLTMQSTLSIGASGVLNLEASTASTTGNVTIAAGGAVKFTGSGTWTINGTWTDNNTSAPANWAVSTSTVRIIDAAAGTLTFWTAASANEFNNLTLDSSVAAGFTYTQVNALQTAGTLTIQNTAVGATGAVIFDATASNYNSTVGGLVLGALGAYTSRAASATVNGNVSVAPSGYITSAGLGTWSVAGSWTNNTASGSWSFLAPITFRSATNQTMTFKTTATEFGGAVTFDTTASAGVTYTMATNALTLSGLLTVQNSVGSPTGNTILDTSVSNLGITAGSVTIGINGTLQAEGSTISVGGNWTVTAANATFTASASTVVFTAAAAINMTQAFNNLTISAGTSTLAANTTVNASLTVSGGILAKDTSTLSTATLTLSGGALTSTSEAGTVTGNVNISSATSYISFGSETWTIGGTWTNSSTSASWSVGTGTVVFKEGSSATMTFAGTNLAGNEFNNVTFDTTAVAGVTFTMSTRGLRVGGVLTVQNSSVGATGPTILDTSVSNLAVTTGALTLSILGAFRAQGSIITINGNVNVSAVNAYMVLGTSAWTVTGTWTNGSTSGSWSAGTSTVTIKSGASATLTFANLGINEFNNLTLDTSAPAGVTYTMATNDLRVGGTLLIQNTAASPTGNAVLVTSNLSVTTGAATVGTNGTLSAGSSTVTVSGNWTVTAANATFVAGTSDVRFTANGTVDMTQSFYNLTVTAGTVTAGSNITVGNALTVSGGTFAKSTATLSAGSLALSGGALTSTSGNVSIAGNVDVSTAGSYIAFGSEAWTVSGSWTNASTSGSWNTGTATVTFNASFAQTMTFAGTNLAGNEFANVTFNSGPSNATFTMATRGLRVGLTLTIGGGVGTTTLDTSGSNLPIGATTLNVIAGGALTANGSTITVASMDTQLGTFTAATSTVVVNASGGTVNVSQTVNNLTVNPAISTTFGGSLMWSGTLTLTSAMVSFGASSLTSSGAATMTFASATITMSTGNWDTSSATTFIPTSSTVTFSGTGSLNLGASASLDTLTISGGTRTLLSQLTANGLLTLSGGTLAKGSNALTANAGLMMSGGSVTSVSGAVSITGNVNISAAASYISFGSETWNVSGSWTNSSTSASWAVGTATVTFGSSSSQTMSFATLPSSAAEFYNVEFNGGSSTVTFTMAGNTLVWSGTLTVQGGSATTTLATSNLGLTGGALTIGNAGLLAANASAVSVSNVTMTGGSSGTITLTTGGWTVSGNWDTSGSGSTLAAGTSTVTLTGASTTVNLAPGQMFYDLTIGGTVFASSTVTASATLAVNDGAVLTKTGQSIGFNALAETGTGSIRDGTVSVTNFTVTNSDATNITTISVFTTWTPDTEYTWTHSSIVGTSTLTFTIGGNSLGGRFNVTKDGGAFTSGLVDGSGQVVFTMLGSDPVIDVVVAAPCGNTRFWIGGNGNWSDTAHWASSSGGVGGCSVPSSTRSVFFDSSSAGGVVTVDQNAAMSSLDTTGWTGTIAIGTFDFAVSGNIAHAAGTITIGASSGNGLTATGNLTVSGSAVLDGSGAASVVGVAGNTVISSATAYFKMGSGTWTFGGSWSNGSTSAAWAPGTGTVLFDSASSRTMTFASFAAQEFYNVTFGSTATSGAIVFTMGTNPLKWSGTLTIQDSAGSTTALATANLALTGGSLIVGNSGILTANASAVLVVDVTMNAGTSGAMTLTSGTWTVSGNWDSSGAGSTFTKGISSVLMTGTTKAVRILNSSAGFYNLTVSGAISQTSALDVSGTLSVRGTLTTSGNNITGGANLTVSGGGTLIGTTASISVAGVTMNDSSANTISLTSGSIAVSGSWDTSGPSSTFVTGTSTVTLTGASGTITLGASQAFANLIIAGSLGQASQLTASSLTISGGGLAKGTFTLTVNGDLTLSGGYLTSVSGTVSIAGNVNVSSASSYIAFGSEAWTISGSWTNASTSASWSTGSGVVTFNASASQTMTFAGTNLSGNEFDTVVFNSGSSTVTFTMAGSPLFARSITIQGGSGTTTLSTSGSDLAIGAGTLTVASGGTLIANGSVVTVRSMDTSAGSFTAGTSTVVVDASGGSIKIPQVLYSLTVNPGISTTFSSNITWSGTLTLTGATVVFSGDLTSTGPATLRFGSATISIAGSWATSSATALTSAGSSVTFTGSGRTLSLGAGQQFATLTIAGTIALASNVMAESLTVSASSILTKTNFEITFNSLAVNGTVADGTVNASAFTVTNSDATALVTISVFTTWTGGSAYAWTHSSSETSQTITWTIGGNTSGYLYTVTKDGAPFANGTVNSSGEVVFTMLGSDPAMRVDVAAPIIIIPPPPEWWQVPYILAIPPIGFLMVVAMFAQRRRWRPAKAFLVDERGQLLREFTLDPSCQVTYEQACQAGALDAQEKDVKVSKYHARTVVGDALAVVLLAYGPVNLQEVEFAREILANIQDKFEDRVKERLAEARAAETGFEDRTKVLQEAEADLQTRSRVFGDMVNVSTIARTKLNAEAEVLGTKEADVTSRESLLAQDRKSLDDLARQLESLRYSLDDRKTEAEERETDMAQTAEALTAREESLAPREQSLSQRESELPQKGSTLREGEAALAAAQANLAADTEAFQAKVIELDRRDQDLADERKALDDLTTEYVADRKSLDSKGAELEARQTEIAQRLQEVEARESSLAPKGDELARRESEFSVKEASYQAKADALAAGEASLAKDTEAMVGEKAELDGQAQELAEERKSLEDLTQELDRRQEALDAQLVDVNARQADVTNRIQDLEAIKNNLGPRESAVLQREKEFEERANGLADQEVRLQNQTDLVGAKALEIQQRMEAVKDKENAIGQDRALLTEARAAFEAERRELESKVASFNNEIESRRDELNAQGRSLGEQELKLAREKEDFEAMRADKSHWIASKDIELEAREQSLMEKEAAVRAQAEENARSLTDLADREETLEIESSKIDKARAELEAKKSELASMGKDLEAKAAKGRDEEARKAEELRTWQATLESEQALLKEQRESFEAEMAEVRESWAGRMLRVEQREAELEEREAKVSADVEWVARNEDEIAKRERTADETLKTANALKAESERLHRELEERAMEVESRERSVREDAANFSIELQKRTETLAAAEADLAGRKAQVEREQVTKAQRLQEKDEDLAKRAQSLDAKLADLEGREMKLTSMQDSLRQEGDRIARERSDLQSLAQQIEAKQLDLAQTKERQEAEANHLRDEADAMHESLAAKEADLRSERDRLERESAALQEKLGAKAQEMAAREKALNAREGELRSEEQDLESRIREIESRDRQLQAHAAEMQTQAETLVQRGKDLSARSAQFDQTVQRFEAEAAAKRQEWEDLQATLKSQEAQLAASAETRQSEITKRMEELDHRERSLNATTAQLQLERSRLDAHAKALAAKEADAAGSLSRSEKRYTELKSMEEELLKSRQAFESERAAWSAHRSDELKQLEATRDAAAEQTQQAERLIEESQRRAFVASEAEKAAKRQGEELAARQAQLEARRAEAEKAERDLQAQMAQFTELSQKIAARENELAARIRELESRQGKLSAAEQASTAAADELRDRKATLDQEASRLATLAAETERRRAEDDARHAAIEAKLEEIAKRDQQLTTELQRADNLMEDLARKEASIQAKEKGFASREAEFAQREAALVERSKELMGGMASLEKMKKDHATLAEKIGEEHRVAASARKEADAIKAEADKMKTQAEAMQAEVSKNMRFLQKKALDVLDREEKIRTRETKIEEENRALETRAQILEGKEKSLDVERDDLAAKVEKLKAENEKLRAKMADQEKAQKPVVDMEEWKRDIDNRVKIIQRKALELLDREEKLRKREEELKALADQLGVKP